MTDSTEPRAEGPEPCPFCSCDELQYEGDGVLHWLSCLQCHACSPVVDSEAEVTPAWNKRGTRPTTDTVEREKVEDLAEAMAKANHWGHSSNCATSEFVKDRCGPCDCGSLAMWRVAAHVAIRALPSAGGGEDKLREALEEIKTLGDWHTPTFGNCSVGIRMAEIARAALQQEQDK